MRIAQIAPLFESVPPSLYGGSERVVSWLTDELVTMGHEVTLFASGDSQTKARLIPMCRHALWRDRLCRETLPHHVALVEAVFRQADQFDILHFHCDYVHFPLAHRAHRATVTTMHGLIHPQDLETLLSLFPDVPLVSISHSQRRPLPHAAWCGTVPHGLPRSLHTFREEHEGYLLFLGRISPDKGIEMAIEIAELSRTPLKIAAKIYDEDRSYYESKIVPLLASNEMVQFLGEVGGQQKDELLGKAKALLFPIQWDEPFGLVLIEALACGTPIIASRRGSVPEIVEDKVHGFLIDNVSEAISAITCLDGIDRRACRMRFEERFCADRMAKDYLALYEQQIAKRCAQ